MDKIKELTGKGIIPAAWDRKRIIDSGEEFDVMGWLPDLMGQCAGAIHDVKPAADIISEMMETATKILSGNVALVSSRL